MNNNSDNWHELDLIRRTNLRLTGQDMKLNQDPVNVWKSENKGKHRSVECRQEGLEGIDRTVTDEIEKKHRFEVKNERLIAEI